MLRRLGGHRAGLATWANVGGAFSLTPDQAKQSFDLYALGFVPRKVSVVSVTPVLLPFTAADASCAYAGQRFSDRLVEAVKVDPFHWHRSSTSRLDMDDNSKLLVDTPSTATKDITLLPAYMFEFTLDGSSRLFPYSSHYAFVGAQTGRAGGAKMFTFRDGAVEAFRFFFSRDSFVPAFAKFIVLLWWPALLQGVLGSGLLWATYRTALAPRVAVWMDRALPSQWHSQALRTLLSGQFAMYDPESDVFQLRARQRAQEFLHDFIHKVNEQQQQQQQGPRQTEDFFRDLFRFQSTHARQQEFFKRMQQEHARQQQEFNQRHMGGQSEEDLFSRSRRRRRVSSSSEEEAFGDFFGGGGGSASSGQGQSEADMHALLGVKPGATQQEIQRGYREQLLKFHPDHYKGDAQIAQKKTQQIIDAYRTLKTTAKK